MKYIFPALLFFLTVISSFAQKPGFATIKGYYSKTTGHNKSLTEVHLYKPENGGMTEIAKSTLGDKNSFGFTFIPEKDGIFMVGSKLFRDDYPVYVKKNKVQEVDVKGHDYHFIGKVSRENKLMEEWYHFSNDIRKKAYFFSSGNAGTFEDFYPMLDAFVPAALKFADDKKIKDKEFARIFKDYTVGETYNIMLMHMFTPRRKHPKDDQIHQSYKDLAESDFFKTTSLLDLPFGNSLLSQYVYLKLRLTKSKFTVSNVLGLIPNDTLKGQFLAGYLTKLKDYGSYSDLMSRFGKYIVTDYQKELVNETEQRLAVLKTGIKAIDFEYEDRNGKKYALSDFKGKVVLVDVWASWCGPCLRQIPYLKKLEKEFKGKDVVFIGVSVDEVKNKKKWLEALDQKKPVGIQIWAKGWNSHIAKAYKIRSIPRFLLFDKEGNIISVDAPRPSDPKLKSLIEEYLKK